MYACLSFLALLFLRKLFSAYSQTDVCFLTRGEWGGCVFMGWIKQIFWWPFRSFVWRAACLFWSPLVTSSSSNGDQGKGWREISLDIAFHVSTGLSYHHLYPMLMIYTTSLLGNSVTGKRTAVEKLQNFPEARGIRRNAPMRFEHQLMSGCKQKQVYVCGHLR